MFHEVDSGSEKEREEQNQKKELKIGMRKSAEHDLRLFISHCISFPFSEIDVFPVSSLVTSPAPLNRINSFIQFHSLPLFIYSTLPPPPHPTLLTFTPVVSSLKSPFAFSVNLALLVILCALCIFNLIIVWWRRHWNSSSEYVLLILSALLTVLRRESLRFWIYYQKTTWITPDLSQDSRGKCSREGNENATESWVKELLQKLTRKDGTKKGALLDVTLWWIFDDKTGIG